MVIILSVVYKYFTMCLILYVVSGMDALREIQQSSSRKNAFTNVALNKILGNNLSAKYSLNGNLSKYYESLF